MRVMDNKPNIDMIPSMQIKSMHTIAINRMLPIDIEILWYKKGHENMCIIFH